MRKALCGCLVIVLLLSCVTSFALERRLFYSDKDIQDQCRDQNEVLYTLEGYWIYGVDFSRKKDNLSKVHIEGGEKYKIADLTTRNFRFYDEWIVFQKLGDRSNNLYKMRTSGKDRQVFIKRNVYHFFFYDDSLYFTDGDKNHALFSCDIDGNNTKKVVEKGCFFPVIIYEDTLIYQYDNGKTAYLTEKNLKTGKTVTLSEQTCGRPIFDGEHVYYLGGSKLSANDNYENLSIYRTDGKTTEKLVNGGVSGRTLWLYDDYIFYGNAKDEGRLYRISKDGGGKDKTQISELKNTNINFINNNNIYYHTSKSGKYEVWSSTINGGSQRKWDPFK